MKQRNRLPTVAYAGLLLGYTLGGCTTHPMPEDSERARVLESPSSGGRVEFPTKKFFVESPPAPWEITKEYASAVVAWKSTATRSTIQIFASNPSGLSYRGRAEIFLSAFKIALREKNREAAVTLVEENEGHFNDKQFYQVLANYDISPTEGVQVRGKLLLYLLKTKAFDYQLVFTAVLGAYEKDRLIIEQMVRSFAPIG